MTTYVHIRGITPKDQMLDYERRMREIGRSHLRGIAFSLNGVAKETRSGIEAEIPKAIDKPTPWMKRGFRNSFINLKTDTLEGSFKDDVGSSVAWKDDQSIVAKYLMGEGDNVHEAGDVGAEVEGRIANPMWKNLRYCGINPIKGPTLPARSLETLMRRAVLTGQANIVVDVFKTGPSINESLGTLTWTEGGPQQLTMALDEPMAAGTRIVFTMRSSSNTFNGEMTIGVNLPTV